MVVDVSNVCGSIHGLGTVGEKLVPDDVHVKVRRDWNKDVDM